jgi:hypothetical protein
MNAAQLLQIGDVLLVPKLDGAVSHMGLVVDADRVLHNIPERGEHLATVAEFSKGRPISVIRTNASPEVVRARAQSTLARPRRYDLFRNNCEHTISRILSGIEKSPQLAAWMIVILLAGAAYLVARRR